MRVSPAGTSLNSSSGGTSRPRLSRARIRPSKPTARRCAGLKIGWNSLDSSRRPCTGAANEASEASPTTPVHRRVFPLLSGRVCHAIQFAAHRRECEICMICAAIGRGIILPSPRDHPQEIRHGDQGRRQAARRQADGKHRIRFRHAVRDAAQGSQRRARRSKGKKIAIFGLPGAYTPTCSAKHVPGYLQNIDQLKKKGVSESLVRGDQRRLRHGALGPSDQKALGKIRFLADGSAQWAKALGLELDLNARGMGTRMNRFSMLVDNGVVKQLNVEGPGKFEVSDAGTMLKQLG